MTLYEDRIAGHPLVPAVESALQTIAAIPPQVRSQNALAVDRTLATFNMLRLRLADRQAAAVVSDTFLSNAHSWVTQAQQEAANATANGNVGHLTNMLAQAEALAQNFGQLPTSPDNSAFTALLEEATSRVGSIQEEQHKASERSRILYEQQQAELQRARDAAAENLERLRAQEKIATDLLAALGEKGTSSDYLITAANEKADADTWRQWTVGAAVLSAFTVIGITVWSLLDTSAEDGTVTRLLTRLTLSVPLVALVVYFARQASEHRQQERRARSLGLQLGSVSTFVADLSDDRRAELKSLLSQRFYTGDQTASAGKQGQAALDASYPSSKELFEFVMNLTKR